MSPATSRFVYVVKHPGQKAEAVTLAEGVTFHDEVYRVLESAAANPPGRKASWGDRAYPEQFSRPSLRVIFDDEFGTKRVRLNCWGIRGPLIVARLEDDRYSSLDPEEAEGIIEELNHEVRTDPNDWEQTVKSWGKYF